MTDDLHASLIVPAGTQIITLVETTGNGSGTVHPQGTVASIVKSPADNTHSYMVRFGDGSEAPLKRHELAIRKHVQKYMLDKPGEALKDRDLNEYVIYRCIVGSRAFGLDSDTSDYDRRGIYLPPANLHWSIYGVPEQIESRETEECYWELQKFMLLALKANPNVLECLYTPLIETATPIAEQLLAQRQMFLSQMVYQTYNGYALSQFKKLEQDLRTRGEVRWKHVMHLIRLLISGSTILQEGLVQLQLPAPDRAKLREIKAGNVAWDEVNRWRIQLHEDFEQSYRTTKLPERPNYHAANEFLISARKFMI